MDRMSSRWTVGCAIAEAVGMTAAASAARAGVHWVGTPVTAADSAMLVGLAVAGGLIEAFALGLVTAWALRHSVVTLPRARWTAVTVAVAGLSWAAGSVPAALSTDPDTAGSGMPSLWLVVSGAAAIGLATGALLGAAQSLVLRGHVRHPWRWCTASCLAWPLPMAVIFLGAGIPDAAWPTWQVLALAVPTGLVAGALLGAVLAACVPSLSGTPVTSRVVLRLLRRRAGRAVLPGIVGLAVRGRRSGVRHMFPVATAEDEAGLVVLVGHARRKTWWRNLMSPTTVGVLRDGSWHEMTARVVVPGDPARAQAAVTYARRHPRASTDRAVLVRIRPGAVAATPAPARDEARSRA